MTAPRWRTTALVAVVLAGSGCTPGSVDAGGAEIDRLYWFFSALAVVVFTVTAGLILWSIVRYRARPGDDSLPTQTHSHVALEIVWFAIPQIIVIVLFLVSVNVLGIIDRDPEARVDGAPDPLVVEAEAFQWGWRFTFEESGVSVAGTAQDPPEILLPVDVPLLFRLRSDDVIHSFYVPRFMTKRDVVPGHDNTLSITITEEGVYEGKCAEFCGLFHGAMNFTIRSVPAPAFEAWLAGGAATGGGE